MAKDFRDAVIAYRNGAPVKFTDIGQAIDGLENEKVAAWYNGRPALILNVKRQPGANIIAVVDAIKELLPAIQKSAPRALSIEIAADRTTTIRTAVYDVQQTLAITVALVILVIFLFLRKFWATLIPSVTLPATLIATFGVMAALGFSLDNLSLMALSIASGFIVDDAIVMIENIVRYIEAGERPIDAALKGSRQIGFTIVSLTISLVAVFIPLLLMGGVVGRLFREFSITLSIAIVISGILSLVLTPMMCATLLKRQDAGEQGLFFRKTERAFDAMRDVYEAGLIWSLRHRTLTLVLTILTFVASIWLYVLIPKGFVPEQDTGLIGGVTDAAQDVSFENMSLLQRRIAEIIGRDPDVVSVSSFVGIGEDNPTVNSGRLYIDIGPPDRRSASADEIMQRLHQAVAGVHDISLHLQPVQDIQIESRLTRTRYQYVLQHLDAKELRQWADKFLRELQKQPELADVTTDQQDLGQQLMIDINRDAAARFGLRRLDHRSGSVRRVRPAPDRHHLRAGLSVQSHRGGRSGISQHRRCARPASIPGKRPPSRRWPIPQPRPSSSTAKQPPPVPLSTFAKLDKRLAPLIVTHQNEFPAVALSFNLAPGVSLGQALDAVRRSQAAIGLPDAIQGTWSAAPPSSFLLRKASHS